jgi:1-phosphofructokinase family hexose kinase
VILTVTLNAALDVTYRVAELRPGESHRVSAVDSRAGGKGVNVARVLHHLGHETLVTGLAGGATGAAVRADLAAAGIPTALHEVAGEARRTVTTVSTQDGSATAFNEPGPVVSPREWADFLDRYRELAGRARVVVLSGSLPAGLPEDAYAQLTGDAVTILDTSGPPLLAGLAGRPHVVKPNAAELAEVTSADSPAAGAARLRELGARAVVASLGAEGLLAVTESGGWRARGPETVRGNPTGAGDACVAALAAGLATGAPWPEVLADAVALSAAAVAHPLAGDVDPDTYRRLKPRVAVEDLDADPNP